uniref:Uncharacterized protein n=1 Tax=Oryza glumipatula TaxID=40148 RepID=A0A0E0BUM0_9ORYZ
MTASGCLFLSSWTKCFTEAFAKGKSWNGSFTLADFKVSSGHVLRLRKPKRFGVEGMRNDMEAFITEIERIFVRQHSQLRFSYPPYFSDFKHRLQNLKMSNNVLSEQCKLLLENHISGIKAHHELQGRTTGVANSGGLS